VRTADDLPTLVMPKVKIIHGLKLPGTPWATSACRGRPLLYFLPSLRNNMPSPFLRHRDVLRVLKMEWKVTMNYPYTECFFLATTSTEALPHRRPSAGASRDSCGAQYGDNINMLYLSAKPHLVTFQMTLPFSSYSPPTASQNSFIGG